MKLLGQQLRNNSSTYVYNASRSRSHSPKSGKYTYSLFGGQRLTSSNQVQTEGLNKIHRRSPFICSFSSPLANELACKRRCITDDQKMSVFTGCVASNTQAFPEQCTGYPSEPFFSGFKFTITSVVFSVFSVVHFYSNLSDDFILMPPNDHLCSLCPRGKKNIHAEHRRLSGMPLHRIRLIAFFSNFGLSRGNVFKRKRVNPKQCDHT